MTRYRNASNPPCGFVLMFPDGAGFTKVLNSECASKRDAATLLSDRKANGQALAGEYIALNVPDVQHTRARYDMSNYREA